MTGSNRFIVAMAVEPFCLYVLGRLHGVGRERLDRAVAAAGGRRVRQPSARVTVVALGHTSASHVLEAGIAQLPGGVPAGAELVSEIQLKRRLGLAAQGPAEQRQLTAADLARTAGLAEETVRWLTLYDVLDGEGGRFGFRDLRAAREVKRLLGDGYPVCAIVAAAAAPRRSGRGLHDTSLAEAPWGEILQKTTGRLARLDGQYILPLDEAFESADALLDRKSVV
jgi:hypothetical protein